jgi:hypothetical protein
MWKSQKTLQNSQANTRWDMTTGCRDCTDIKVVCCVYRARYTQGTTDCTLQESADSRRKSWKKNNQHATYEIVRNLNMYRVIIFLYTLWSETSLTRKPSSIVSVGASPGCEPLPCLGAKQMVDPLDQRDFVLEWSCRAFTGLPPATWPGDLTGHCVANYE